MFNVIQFIWKMVSVQTQKTSDIYEGFFSSETTERRTFELRFNQKYHETALNSYLLHVLEKSKVMKEANKVVYLQTLGDHYGSVVLNHPSTFDTLAMDPVLKEALIDDLNRFLKRKDYYKRGGKAWKRGYLLYGPPGTGKSSLIAAMANYLKFDIYDMELSSMRSNADLRRLLVSTKNQSIVVIEDIDCSIDLDNREAGGPDKNDSQGNIMGYESCLNLASAPTNACYSYTLQLTLSGLLNFIDGLWSSCGDERIIVFTTNHRDRLDRALLRPGRMEMHINMSYCTPDGFRILASNYLGIEKHETFEEIEKLLKDIQATPAEIAEQFMRYEEAALEGVIKFLNVKKTEQSKQNAGEIEVKSGGNEDAANANVASKVKRYKRITGNFEVTLRTELSLVLVVVVWLKSPD
ncbi:hypothetical protein LIER_01073 [Lithospermum erythrorhizon]|uniref:AAA+ ATPase domain-containing protein n=1 Tax=Lithospermum erythrorhizon TaxID=34254 RepID=A0AAV3NJK5_LITER